MRRTKAGEMIATTARPASAQRSADDWRGGPLARYLAGDDMFDVAGGTPPADAGHAAVLSAHRLQDIPDYRAALQAWFAATRVGGHLIVIVPRGLPRPSGRSYTPGMLLEQVEEALAPNSYRVRMLGEDGDDIMLALERIAPPAWGLDIPYETMAAAPDYAFEPRRTRVEVSTGREVRTILILKLDRLGDFIMGLRALDHARAVFRDAEITLVVDARTLRIARDSGLADHVVSLDAYPRDAVEEEIDVPGRIDAFRRAIPDRYDLAIDLRVNPDTRILLNDIDAGLRAGIGPRSMFPHLDIFLPFEFGRDAPEIAHELDFTSHDFVSQGPVVRQEHRSISQADTVERSRAIIRGPRHRLRAGRYRFEPWIEIDPRTRGQLLVDVALDGERVVAGLLPARERIRLPFEVGTAEVSFEFRIWTVPDMPSIDFSFYGGRLVRLGADSALHPSDTLSLLIDLVRMRLDRTGLLAEAGGSA